MQSALDRISFIIGEEASDMIVEGEVKIKPKQLVDFAGKSTTAIKTIWPLLAEGLPYTDAIKTTGGAILNLSWRRAFPTRRNQGGPSWPRLFNPMYRPSRPIFSNCALISPR